MLPAHQSATGCTDPPGRRLLFRYASRAASEFEQRAFERHMLECDLCYEDFLAVWRVTDIVDSWPPSAHTTEADGDLAVLPPPDAAPPRPLRRRIAAWFGLGLALGLAIGSCV